MKRILSPLALIALLHAAPLLAQEETVVSTPKASTHGSLVAGKIPVANAPSQVIDSGKVPPAGDIVGTTDTQTITNKTISGASNTVVSLPNSALVNPGVTIAGHLVLLGGSQALGCADLTGVAPSCGTDATNAANITSGLLPNARLSAVPNSALANSSVTIAGHLVSLGGSQLLGCADLTGVAPSCGTDATNAANITSGILPNARLSAVPNGALANSSLTIAGHIVSLGGSQLLGCADLTGVAPSCGTDATNAANITSGILPNARLSAVPNSALANSSVTIAGHVVSLGGSQLLGCADLTGVAASCGTDATNAANITSGILPNGRLSAVPNSALANSSMTIAGHPVSLGGTQTLASTDLSDGSSLVTLSGTQTLANKTLTAPTISGQVIESGTSTGTSGTYGMNQGNCTVSPSASSTLINVCGVFELTYTGSSPIGSPGHNVAGLCYFVDADPNSGDTLPLSIACEGKVEHPGSDFITALESINLELSSNLHPMGTWYGDYVDLTSNGSTIVAIVGHACNAESGTMTGVGPYWCFYQGALTGALSTSSLYAFGCAVQPTLANDFCMDDLDPNGEIYSAGPVVLANTLSIEAGSQGAPSLFFTGSATTGWYQKAANQLGITVSGTTQFFYATSFFEAANANGPIVANAGSSASQPVIAPNRADTFAGIGGASGNLDLFSDVASASIDVLRIANGQVYGESPAPTASSCGTSPSVTGSGMDFTVTVGTGTISSCTLTWTTAWNTLPICTKALNTNAVLADISARSTTAITFTFSSSVTGGTGQIYAHCFG